MGICWERADLLAFRLCCFILCRLDLLCSFPVWCLRKEVEFDCLGSWSLPFHLFCLEVSRATHCPTWQRLHLSRSNWYKICCNVWKVVDGSVFFNRTSCKLKIIECFHNLNYFSMDCRGWVSFCHSFSGDNSYRQPRCVSPRFDVVGKHNLYAG